MATRKSVAVVTVFVLGIGLAGCIFDYGDECEIPRVISGRICDMDGIPLAGVKVRAFFDPMEGVEPAPDCSVYTDPMGCYSVPYEPGVREITVLPTRTGCVFSPYSMSYDNPAASLPDQDYLGYCSRTYRISGHIRNPDGWVIRAAVVILKDADGFERGRCVTDDFGYYAFDGLAPTVEYTATPYSWCDFTPECRCYSGIEEDLTDQDFVGTCRLIHYVDGYVRDSQGDPIAGVPIDFLCIGPFDFAASSDWKVYTDETGHYMVSIIGTGDGTCFVTPEKQGCRFLPPCRGYGYLEDDLSGQDFTAYCGDGFDIDGHVFRPDGRPYNRAWMTLWSSMEGPGAEYYLQATTDTAGWFEFSNLVPGIDYTLRARSSQPCPRGEIYCTFDPPERYYFGLDRHYQDQDFMQVCPD